MGKSVALRSLLEIQEEERRVRWKDLGSTEKFVLNQIFFIARVWTHSLCLSVLMTFWMTGGLEAAVIPFSPLNKRWPQSLWRDFYIILSSLLRGQLKLKTWRSSSRSPHPDSSRQDSRQGNFLALSASTLRSSGPSTPFLARTWHSQGPHLPKTNKLT